MEEDQGDRAALPAKPRVVVGLDLGTTFSGFAYAHVSDPDSIYTFYDYPKGTGGEKPYCKTLTACYYKPLAAEESFVGADLKETWKLQSWGYPARTDYERDIQAHRKYRTSQEPRIPNAGFWNPSSADSSSGVENFLSKINLFRSWDTSQPGASDGVAQPIPQAPSVGVYLSRFKLHLASRSTEGSSATPLPPGLTVVQVITDYLRELGGLILKHLQSKYGAHLNSKMVQWCITVPSIWDNSAKATMRTCMVSAGLVSVHHPVTIVLEPEAASFHCQRVMSEVVLEAGNKLLVADIGGGTSDIVVQEVVEPRRRQVKEVTMSSGGLCGGTYVDSRFMEFLAGRIGQACLSHCILKHPNVYGQLMKEWECTKSVFDSGQGVTALNLPNKLAVEWEKFDMESGHAGSQEYEQLEISSQEMQSIFDPVVQQNIELIQRQMVEARGNVQVLAMVGGFSESPYLFRKMKEAFGAMAEAIICPPNPGSAICQGAVALALNPNAVVSRICKLTYGYGTNKPFNKGIDPIGSLLTDYSGRQWCQDRFVVLVKKGDVVVMDEAVTTLCEPLKKGCKSLGFNLFSCDDMYMPPRYTTDKRMQKEGILEMDISGDMELEDRRIIELSLCFGGSSLEVKARAMNFNAEQVQLPVEVDYLLS